MARLIAEGPAEELARTVNTQPVMVTAGVAAYRLWRSLGGDEPAFLAGHSLGEYSALVAAGAISFADCLPLVRLRGQAMQEAVPAGTGAMAAILGLEDALVREACATCPSGEVAEAVNFNSPGQVVIAGSARGVELAVEACKARGAKRAVLLPVSAPFHSSLMKPAAERLAVALQAVEIKAPRIPVIHNVDAQSHAEPDAIRAALVAQADHPVRWVECIQAMAARGVSHVYECGPGKVLAPQSKRIDPALTGLALVDLPAIEQGISQWRALQTSA
jgi:[acyl-carrier-protein] S-malonyltransferase